MLKKSLIFALIASAVTLNGLIFAVDRTNPMTSNIEQQLNAAVQKAEADVQEKFTQATRQDVVPLWADKVALENAIMQLEVKKTLVNNFIGTPSLNNPIIQEKLVEILNKSVITESDLAGLENLVTREKAKMNANSAAKPASTQPVSNPANLNPTTAQPASNPTSVTPPTSQPQLVPSGQ